MQKTFLLCVGSQKSGTTWLHQYLDAHPNANMGFAKEYHVFDALFVSECKYIIENRIKEAIQIFQEQSFPLEKRTTVFRLLDLCGNPDNYFDYFYAIANQAEDTLLTGDITPSYSALSAEALQFIKNGLEERGFKVKVVFLMRDPVERCISAGRMYFMLRGLSPTVLEENKLLRDAYASDEFRIRTRYDLTIQNIEKTFAAQDIQYHFYEKLFQNSSIERLTDFLSIPWRQPDFACNPNPSEIKNEIDGGLRKEIFLHYQCVYDFISKRFGTEVTSELWKTY